MPPSEPRPTGSDRRGRITALAIAFLALLLMLWIGREDVPGLSTVWTGLTGSTTESAGTGNPELDACLAQRVGDVDQMRADGVINDSQYDTFRGRAVSFCEAQFPPSQ
ncbi:MAG: hypothetical protein JJ902_21110 [Roseibium sp.]|nr:hypothetical protein [Roseibium sp.]